MLSNDHTCAVNVKAISPSEFTSMKSDMKPPPEMLISSAEKSLGKPSVDVRLNLTVGMF